MEPNHALASIQPDCPSGSGPACPEYSSDALLLLRRLFATGSNQSALVYSCATGQTTLCGQLLRNGGQIPSWCPCEGIMCCALPSSCNSFPKGGAVSFNAYLLHKNAPPKSHVQNRSAKLVYCCRKSLSPTSERCGSQLHNEHIRQRACFGTWGRLHCNRTYSIAWLPTGGISSGQ